RAANALSFTVGRTIETILSRANFDFVHLHDPFVPNAASAALRHSQTLSVGTFHLPNEWPVATQVTRRFQGLFLGRLDARTASYVTPQQLLAANFPAEYRLIRPGVASQPSPAVPRKPQPPRIFFCAQEGRSALRRFAKLLRRLALDHPWEACIWAVDAPPAL